jgi:TrmH family RNA methyltransferase
MEGIRTLAALATGATLPQYRLQEIWVSSDCIDLANGFSVPAYAVRPDLMELLSDCRTAPGILGVVSYAETVPEIRADRGNYLLLDAVADPGNLGTLVRSAAAFGFGGVFLHGECVELFNPKTVRSTMGTLPFSHVWRTDQQVFRRFDELGYEILTTVLRGGASLYSTSFGRRNVLVIGNEAHGVSRLLLEKAARRISIPMVPEVESLNAAVAGAICMSWLQNVSA